MVFNGEVVVRVATLSAELCQYVSFNPERFSGRDVLRLICCLPFRHLALCLCSFFLCLPSPSYYRRLRLPRSLSSSSSSSSSSSDDDEDDDLEDYVYDHPHSD